MDSRTIAAASKNAGDYQAIWVLPVLLAMLGGGEPDPIRTEFELGLNQPQTGHTPNPNEA
jgi:hypothetical protein